MSRREQWADTPTDQDHIEAVRLDAQEHRHDHADHTCADTPSDDPCEYKALMQAAWGRLADELGGVA